MIKEKIKSDLIAAMKSRNELEVRVLRFVLSQINYAEIDKKRELKDEEVVTELYKEQKKRKEAIVLFKKGKRNDLVTDEENQLKVLSRYLPAQLSEDELGKIVEQVVISAADTSNPGKMIGLVMGRIKGQADGSVVARLVKEKIGNLM